MAYTRLNPNRVDLVSSDGKVFFSSYGKVCILWISNDANIQFSSNYETITPPGLTIPQNLIPDKYARGVLAYQETTQASGYLEVTSTGLIRIQNWGGATGKTVVGEVVWIAP